MLITLLSGGVVKFEVLFVGKVKVSVLILVNWSGRSEESSRDNETMQW